LIDPNPQRPAGVIYTKPWMVELILDLAGYCPDRPLAKMVALEPSAGDGAFLNAMVRRLVESCRRHGTPFSQAGEAIVAFEIDADAAEKAIRGVYHQLLKLSVPESTASLLAQSWVKIRDFLEASLAFPIADFVIGNPPYIRLEEIPANKALFYRNGFSAMRGRADVYIAFYQAGLLQLRRGGVCAYICADRWMLNDYGSALRDFITCEGYNVRFVIEAHDVEAFDTEVSAYPAVTIIAREKQGPVVVAKARPGIEAIARETVVAQLNEARSDELLRVARFPGWFRGDEPWTCSSPEALKLLKQLEATCLPLESDATGTQIGIGVATGADRVFIRDSMADVENDRLLPLAMANDLKAGRVEWSGRYLVNPWNQHGLIDLRSYPRFEAYLRPHFELLKNRHTARERQQQWHKTIDRVSLPLLKKNKLYIADIKDRLLPALDLGRTYPHHNLYWVTSESWDLRVLGALLMSAVGEFFIHCYGVRMRGGFLRFQAQYLRRIRVPVPGAINPELTKRLRAAFDEQDFASATLAALEAYQIDSVPLQL
jgi:adenine-specific DNA-methyltransferase